jgi:hypothetical protein
MATYYVSSVDGSNSDNGTTWALAVATLEYAVETLAATGGPHTILVDSAHSESFSADTTITPAQDLRIISVNRAGSDAPLAGALIGAQSTNYSLNISGSWDVYVFGVEMRNGTGSTSKDIGFGVSDGAHFEAESCIFNYSGSAAAGRIFIGLNTTNGANAYVRMKNCTLKFGATGQGLAGSGPRMVFEDCSIDSAGSSPAALIRSQSSTGSVYEFINCDLSHLGGNTLIADFLSSGTQTVVLSNCKIGANMVMMAAPTTVLNKGQTTVWAFNCDDGDEHFRLYHGDALGETRAFDTVYLSDGPSLDGGTTRVSWQIITRASNCSFYTPYVSPWTYQWHTGTSQIAPYFEALRSGSTTKYQNDEIWAEFSAQATSGSTRGSFVNDRATIWPLSPADQTASSKGAGDWTGEDATNNAYMKLGEQNITPAELGTLAGRVMVGEPGITVYVCPKIRT